MLRRLVAAYPKDVDTQVLLGTALALSGRRSESIETLRNSVKLAPDSAPAQLSLGMVLARFGEREGARQAYEKAVTLDPKLTMAHLNLGVILAAEGKLDAAVDHFSKGIQLENGSPTAARLHYLRGRVFRQQDLLEKAASDFEKAVLLEPNNSKAFLELGTIRAELGNGPGALEALQKAAHLAPDDADARYQLGSQYLRAGRAHEAVAELEIASRLQPHDQNVLYALARALRGAGRMDDAKQLTERLAQNAKAEAFHDPNLVKAGELNNEGIELEKQGKFAEALERYRVAVELRPQEVGFRRNLALVLCRMERWQEAVVELKEVLRLTPGDADATKALYIALEKAEVKQ